MNERYQIVPPLSDDEFEYLKNDIAERGVQVPVEYDEDGHILDGHHRVRACQLLGLTSWPRVVRKGLSEEQKRAHARSLNLARRQLNRAQKQELIRQQLKETPELSDRQIAQAMGVSDKTVSSRRGEMESTAEIPKLDKTTGADGKTRTRQRNTHQHRVESKPEEKKGPSEQTINNAIAAISESAVPELTEALKNGVIPPATAKRIARLTDIEQRYFADYAKRGGLTCLDSPKLASEHCAMGYVAYDRQGNRHVPEGHPLQEAEFDLERDYRLILEAQAILAQVVTPGIILRFATRMRESHPEHIQTLIDQLNANARRQNVRVDL
ncbi:ParB/RepB/Spo0J family partition protein [Magnetofaba australis]|uniref:Putative Streptomycin biosynthesis operon putative regulatory protein n=1 Tax=Magnetofaba australis IT-1 TaxID=1434232 RepID=A0A1Y2K496_9PROT|nr:ParB/RepB/Spo0J family partition protein [Magnetofaba australis]OSM04170.1 putative Streptomycin biosynthesis operon putative regulatory protein [Magnetofaba australis IT-1]